MSVPISKVKSLCTAAELELVRASRNPELQKLTPAQLKQSAGRARKLVDKWQDQSRGQARAKGRQLGFQEPPAQTRLKAQIFRETLDAFEAKLAAQPGGAAGVGKKSSAKPKRARAAGHRAARADVRMALSDKRIEKNAKSRVARDKAAAAKAAQAPTPAAPGVEAAPEQAAAKKTPPPRFTPPPVAVPKRPPLTGIQRKLAAGANKQLRAVTAAKQARIARSGQTSRMKGHISARGRRAQGRRDSRNA